MRSPSLASVRSSQHSSPPVGPVARRTTAVAVFAALVLAVLASATFLPSSASAAGIEVKQAVAFPMAPGPVANAAASPSAAPQGTGANLVCTADPRNRLYGNDPYDVNAPWDAQKNNPSSDDIVRAPQAGKASDLCIGFALTPNVEPNVVGADYDADHAWRVQPATNPFPDVTETHVWDVAKEEPVDGDDMKDVAIDLPAGLAAAPAAIAPCTDRQFGVGNFLDVACPAASQVGDASFRLSLGFGSLVFHGPMAIGKLYALPAGPDDVARLGAVASADPIIDGTAPVKFVIRITLAPGTGRLRAIVQNAPRQLHGDDQMDATGQISPPEFVNTYLPLYIEGVGIRIWGAKANHPSLPADFAETGTDCGAATNADVSVTTYAGNRSTITSPGTTATGCDQLEFHPTASVTTTERTAGVPTGVGVKLGFGQATSNGLRAGLLRDARVTLPEGLELGAQVGGRDGGLPLCTAAQFGRSAEGENRCPAASAVGDVKITSPLIDKPFTGRIYLGEQTAVGALPALYVDAALEGSTAADAPRVKLAGSVTADDAGRITASFLDNPQLRFGEVALTFPGGDHALFTTPRTCGEHTGTARVLSSARTVADAVPTSLTIDQGCEPVPFAPTTTVEVSDGRVGASRPATIRVNRTDRSAWLRTVDVSLPAGFLADLTVPTECSAAQAQAAACPASARIATVKVDAGTGAAPLPLEGAMYLTEREAGSVAGVSIVVRAKIGGIDLGDVVVPGRIALRPTDAGLDFHADVPTRHLGLALALRSVEVTLDRAGFALNPTACGPLPYDATATGDGGQTAGSSGRVTFTGCASLPFSPALRATLTGDVRPTGYPGMYVELTNRLGDSNLAKASVVLPEGVSAALKNVQQACSLADFGALRCAPNVRVGTATATVSITNEPIVGDVFLIRVPGESLPGLGLNFTGRYAQRVTSLVKVNKDGRLVVGFDAIPDLPLRRLVIDVAGGEAAGPLQLSSKDCAGGTRWDGTFTGQGGQTAVAQTGLRCAAGADVRLSSRSGFSLRLFDFGGRKLQSAKVTLPSGWRFATAAAKRKNVSWARLEGGKATPKFTKTTVTVMPSTKTSTSLRIKVGGDAVKRTGKPAKKAKKVDVKVRFAFTDGAVQTQTVKVAAR